MIIDPTRLSDGNVVLRPLRTADVDALLAAVLESVNELSIWLPWCHAGYSRDDALRYIEESGKAWTDVAYFAFGIIRASDEAFLGAIAINHIAKPNRLANVGYWMRSSCVGRGYMIAAARLAAKFAFEQLQLTRLEIVCMPNNLRSRRVAESLGAQLECIARNRLSMHGTAHDAALYSLVATDLLDLRASRS
jgi:RimJ/RimL family protein N-acetyltransferase